MALIPITLPVLGFDQETGRVAGWLRNIGDRVEIGEPIVELETEKATVEMESTAAGTIVRIVVEPGVDVPIGSVLAWLDSEP